jgi:carboxyl-terminal processing protease
VYEEKNRAGDIKQVPVKEGGLATSTPLVVLVDQGSASSSEIVAGAIQGNDRAKIVGHQTFGTGTVLNTFNLSDGSAVRLGVVEWLTPTGQTIFNQGITPDVPVDLAADGAILEPSALKSMSASQFASAKDAQLQRAVQLVSQ